jgi:aspartate-semialdehyde dehydrogenase
MMIERAEREKTHASLPPTHHHTHHRSAGSKVEFDGETYIVEELVEESFDGVDIALFSAGGGAAQVQLT